MKNRTFYTHAYLYFIEKASWWQYFSFFLIIQKYKKKKRIIFNLSRKTEYSQFLFTRHICKRDTWSVFLFKKFCSAASFMLSRWQCLFPAVFLYTLDKRSGLPVRKFSCRNSWTSGFWELQIGSLLCDVTFRKPYRFSCLIKLVIFFVLKMELPASRYCSWNFL